MSGTARTGRFAGCPEVRIGHTANVAVPVFWVVAGCISLGKPVWLSCRVK
jgi:hypothetical protein